MDILLEFIFEIVIEGAWEVANNKKVPMWIRALVGTVFLVIAGCVILMLLVLGIFFLNEKSILGGILFLLLAIFLFYTMMKRLRILYHEHRKHNDIS